MPLYSTNRVQISSVPLLRTGFVCSRGGVEGWEEGGGTTLVFFLCCVLCCVVGLWGLWGLCSNWYSRCLPARIEAQNTTKHNKTSESRVQAHRVSKFEKDREEKRREEREGVCVFVCVHWQSSPPLDFECKHSMAPVGRKRICDFTDPFHETHWRRGPQQCVCRRCRVPTWRHGVR